MKLNIYIIIFNFYQVIKWKTNNKCLKEKKNYGAKLKIIK